MTKNDDHSDIEWLVDAVEYTGQYRLTLTFRDGSRKIVDLEQEVLQGRIYEPLRDLEYFKKVQLDGTSIAWPNGADFAPEYLYEKGEAITQVASLEQGGIG